MSSDNGSCNFFAAVGSRVFRRDLPKDGINAFITAAKQHDFEVIETKEALYCCTVSRCIEFHNGRLQNEAPLVFYLAANSDHPYDPYPYRKDELQRWLTSKNLWLAGQFGIWHFASQEGQEK